MPSRQMLTEKFAICDNVTFFKNKVKNVVEV